MLLYRSLATTIAYSKGLPIYQGIIMLWILTHQAQDSQKKLCFIHNKKLSPPRLDLGLPDPEMAYQYATVPPFKINNLIILKMQLNYFQFFKDLVLLLKSLQNLNILFLMQILFWSKPFLYRPLKHWFIYVLHIKEPLIFMALKLFTQNVNVW